GQINLNSATEVTGTLGIVNGGTNNTVGGSAGQVVYYDGTKYNYSTTGSSGQILQSNGAGQPTWINSNSIYTFNNGLTLTGSNVQFGGALTQNTTVTGGNFDINFQKSGTGNINLTNSNNTANQLRLFEPSSSGNNYSAFLTQAQTSDLKYVLPSNGGTTNQVLSIVSKSGAGLNDSTLTLGWVNQSSNNAWSLTGNAGTTPGTNFLGTTDNVALQLHVNGIRAMRIEPDGTSPNIIGGYSGNTVTAGVKGAFIGGGGKSGSVNQVVDDYGIVVGGYGGTAGKEAFVGIGDNNTALGSHSGIVTGKINTVSSGSDESIIGAGKNNNITNAKQSVIMGGGVNTVTGDQSSIVGGQGLKIGDQSFGFSGQSSTGTQTDISGTSKVAYFGDVNLWLGNTSNSAKELRFYEPNSSFAYTGTNYTAFKAGVQASDITYTLPTALPGTNGILQSDNSGTLSWINPTSIYTFNNGLTLTGSNVQFGGALTQNTTVTGGNFSINFQKSGSGNINLTNSNNTANELRFYEPSSSGNNYTAFKADPQSADITYILPTAQAASSGLVLTNDGSGNLSWTNPTASGNYWSTSGNNINANAFIGSTNGNDFKVRTGPSVNLIRIVVLSNNGADNGNVGINPVTNASNSYTAPRDNLDVFGNIRISNQGYGTDGSLQGQTGELRLMEPSNGSDYTAFKAGVQSSNITYTLPTSAPSSNNQILTSTTGGVMSWSSAGNLIMAGNGLTNIGDSVILGGSLTQATTIDLGTKNLSLSSVGNSGNIIIGKFTTAGIVKNSAAGILSSGAVNLNSTEVTGTLGIANGGTNNTTAGSAGQVVYYDGTKYNYSTTGTAGQFLQSNGAGQPTWTSPTGIYTFDNGLTLTGSNVQLGGTLIQNTNITSGNFDINFQKSGSGGVNLTNTNNTANQLRFYEASGSGSNYSAFRAGIQSSNITYTLPTALPGTTGILQSNNSGTLSWVSPTSIYTFDNGLTLTGNNVQLGGTLIQNTNITSGNFDFNFQKSGTGSVNLTNTNNTANQLRFYEPSGTGTNYTAFRAVSQTSKFVLQLPGVGPKVNQTLVATSLSLSAGDSVITLGWADGGAGGGGSTDWALLGNTAIDSTINFLGTTDQRPVIFRTNNTERMRILGGSGYVGVGTNNPTAKFTVSDATAQTTAFTSGLISNTATSSTASITKTGLDIQSTGNWTGGSAKNIGLNVNVSGGTTNYSALFNGGNVGTGTTTPNVQMDIDGGLSIRPSTQTISGNVAVTVGNRSYLRLSHNGAANATYTITLTNGLQDGQILVVQFNGCTGTEKLVFNDAGNLNLSGVFSPSATQSTITFVWDGGSWVETARSLN
ncbi:MAG: hypothetical protein JST20_02200, partial [Bacteroidetes bacterium]|nr:hypothetical protein [Bacteroidota bacterium]